MTNADRGVTPSAIWRAALDRDGHACVLCGRGDDLQSDHIIPWSRGGPTVLDNIQVLCRVHNVSKSNLMPREWIARIEKFSHGTPERRAELFERLRPLLDMEPLEVSRSRLPAPRATPTEMPVPPEMELEDAEGVVTSEQLARLAGEHIEYWEAMKVYAMAIRNESMRGLRQQGMTIPAIASLTGVTPARVQQLIR